MMELTPQQLDELCDRSSKGEGVRVVLAGFGCNDDLKLFETLEWLKQHHKRLQNAKCEYRQEPPKHPEPEHRVRRGQR